MLLLETCFYWRLCYYIFRAKNDNTGSPISVLEPSCQQLSFGLGKGCPPKKHSILWLWCAKDAIPWALTLSGLVSIIFQCKRMTPHSTCALIGVITLFRGSTCAFIGDCIFYFFEARADCAIIGDVLLLETVETFFIFVQSVFGCPYVVERRTMGVYRCTRACTHSGTLRRSSTSPYWQHGPLWLGLAVVVRKSRVNVEVEKQTLAPVGQPASTQQLFLSLSLVQERPWILWKGL